MKKCSLRIQENPTEKVAEDFIFSLMTDRKLMYHPDDHPEDYRSRLTGKPTFTKEEAEDLEYSNEILFKKFGNKVYTIGLRCQERAFEDSKKK